MPKQLRLFRLDPSEGSSEVLNRFLRQHRVVRTEQQMVLGSQGMAGAGRSQGSEEAGPPRWTTRWGREPFGNQLITKGYTMRKLSFFFLAVLGFGTVHAQASSSQELSSCVTTFYNPKQYNWFAFHNQCDQAVNVWFQRSDEKTSNFLEIRSGGIGNTGLSRAEMAKAEQHGEFKWVVCPEGYLPKGPSGKYLRYEDPTYKCVKK